MVSPQRVAATANATSVLVLFIISSCPVSRDPMPGKT
jgi:hypothetical protein